MMLTSAPILGKNSVDERVVLLEDGHLRWSSGEKTDYLEYPFIIRGFGIYQDVEEVAADARPDYIFNPEKKTLNSYGEVFYRQK